MVFDQCSSSNHCGMMCGGTTVNVTLIVLWLFIDRYNRHLRNSEVILFVVILDGELVDLETDLCGYLVEECTGLWCGLPQ